MVASPRDHFSGAPPGVVGGHSDPLTLKGVTLANPSQSVPRGVNVRPEQSASSLPVLYPPCIEIGRLSTEHGLRYGTRKHRQHDSAQTKNWKNCFVEKKKKKKWRAQKCTGHYMCLGWNEDHNSPLWRRDTHVGIAYHGMIPVFKAPFGGEVLFPLFMNSFHLEELVPSILV